MSQLPGGPRVQVVILSWNRFETLAECLRSVQESDYPSLGVVVVDNGSVDGSPGLVRRHFPWVNLVENGRNLGFAGGCNVGIGCAMALGADYVLLLNDDTVVAPNMVTALVDGAGSDPEAGIVGPRIYYHDRPKVIWSAGGWVDPDGEPGHLRVDETDSGEPEGPKEVDYVSGCAMLVKREVVDRVGALDDRFFAYFEETEWCARARRAGYRVLYLPRAQMWHKAKSQNPSRLYLYLMARNRLLYLRCCGAGSWTVFQAAMDLLRGAASSLRRGRDRESLACSRAVLKGVGHFAIGRFGAPPAGL